jgi:hypothetical protein
MQTAAVTPEDGSHYVAFKEAILACKFARRGTAFVKTDHVDAHRSFTIYNQQNYRLHTNDVKQK